ncbi:MAG: ABC transporter ATP-binding protein [Candidatus Ratteibacteria bacterium]|nr:ABC transporter ATP-binding protein [Candidatus Ratteibacteria bacterium]
MKRIIAEGISKEFKIGFKKNQPILARVISIFSGREPKRIIKALDNVSLEADAGELLGIIGENGSGKSTLLRIIAGIYAKDNGKIVTNGHIIALINLYIGLKERLTMEDNIYLLGSFWGMSQKSIRERFDAIVEFSELKDFIKTKVYQFSNGMIQRLVFSIAVNCNPDILLLDEVFEVGDEHFKLKSANKLEELNKNGTAVILVSHAMWIIEKYCNRVIWMDKGKILQEGKASEVTLEYKTKESK